MRLPHGTLHPSLTHHCDAKTAWAASRPQLQVPRPHPRSESAAPGRGTQKSGDAVQGASAVGEGECVYTTKYPSSAPACASFLPPLGSPAPAYVLARQTRLHWGVSHVDWDSHFLGQDGQAMAIHEGDEALGQPNRVWLWWGQWKPEATPAPTGPGPDSSSAVSGVSMHGARGVATSCCDPTS